MLQIKKYPNRRYYDATRSCHVTLQEVYDLVRAGHDVNVTDSKSGEDITNVILLQVMLEKDPPKLDVFPTSILHMMVRSNRQAVRTVFDGIFGPFMKVWTNSQRQFDTYVRSTMGGVRTPMDWANDMMRAFMPGSTHGESGDPADFPPDQPPMDHPADSSDQTLNVLKAQVEALQRQIHALSEKNGTGSDSETR